ncbi:MAG TPA: tetratricopeptide repeat protein [Vicinamibacterales bacterium]
MRHRFAAIAAVLVLTNVSCAARSVSTRYECVNADRELREALQQLEQARAKSCNERDRQGIGLCVTQERGIERLAYLCPAHAPTLLANAAIAYDSHDPVKAQQYLDRVLAQSRSQPDAAVLRAKLAIDEGNLPFARRFLTEQIKLAPDHAGLREVHGATLYLSGQLDEARQELRLARRMGAPDWRVAYHLGLVDEAAGQLDAARQEYAESVARNPSWQPARARLTALQGATQAR